MTGRPYYVILAKDPSVENWEYMAEGEAGSPEEAVHIHLKDFDLGNRMQLKIFTVDQTESGDPAIYREGDLQIERSSP